MKSRFALAGIASLVLALSSTAAIAAQGEPIDGVDVKLGKNPGGLRVASGVTDGRGNVAFRNLAPGDYEIFIDGPTLARAMDALAPSKPERHGGDSSLNIGIGGMFGGSHHSHNDGGPVGGSHGSSHGGSSTGGVGVGLNVPLGGHNTDREPGYPITAINISLPSNPDATTIDWGDGSPVSAETAYCHDSAVHGMKFHVTVGRGGTILLSIFDRWGNMSAISENQSPLPTDR